MRNKNVSDKRKGKMVGLVSNGWSTTGTAPPLRIHERSRRMALETRVYATMKQSKLPKRRNSKDGNCAKAKLGLLRRPLRTQSQPVRAKLLVRAQGAPLVTGDCIPKLHIVFRPAGLVLRSRGPLPLPIGGEAAQR